MRCPPAAPPLPTRAPCSLETGRRVPGVGALDSGARASALASLEADGRPPKSVRIYGLACGSGRAMPACQVRGSRRRVRAKEGMARLGAGAGPASAAARLLRLEASIRGAPAGGGLC